MPSRARLLPCLGVAVTLILTAGAAAQQPVPANRRPQFVTADDRDGKEVDPRKARVLLRRVALDLVNVPLEVAIEELATRADFDITYASAQLPKDKRVTMR